MLFAESNSRRTRCGQLYDAIAGTIPPGSGFKIFISATSPAPRRSLPFTSSGKLGRLPSLNQASAFKDANGANCSP